MPDLSLFPPSATMAGDDLRIRIEAPGHVAPATVRDWRPRAWPLARRAMTEARDRALPLVRR